MPMVYWMADGTGLGINSGGPDGTLPIPTVMVRWIRASGTPSLIVNGGDVYPDGKSREFAEFLRQMDGDVRLLCETPGNHDWRDDPATPSGRIPHGYETFWRAHPESKQPVDTTRRGGARYEHVIDVAGWRLIFLDTGDYRANPWPAGDDSRVTWLRSQLQPGRANVVCAHHSRLSRGHHGDNRNLQRLWDSLFDGPGQPRVAFTLGGHDHNVGIYGPRPMQRPEDGSVPFSDGIHVIVNGAGGSGHYSSGRFASGTRADIFRDDDNFCLTRINFIDARSADVDLLSFGTHARTPPVPVPASLIRIRL